MLTTFVFHYQNNCSESKKEYGKSNQEPNHPTIYTFVFLARKDITNCVNLIIEKKYVNVCDK